MNSTLKTMSHREAMAIVNELKLRLAAALEILEKDLRLKFCSLEDAKDALIESQTINLREDRDTACVIVGKHKYYCQANRIGVRLFPDKGKYDDFLALETRRSSLAGLYRFVKTHYEFLAKTVGERSLSIRCAPNADVYKLTMALVKEIKPFITEASMQASIEALYDKEKSHV